MLFEDPPCRELNRLLKALAELLDALRRRVGLCFPSPNRGNAVERNIRGADCQVDLTIIHDRLVHHAAYRLIVYRPADLLADQAAGSPQALVLAERMSVVTNWLVELSDCMAEIFPVSDRCHSSGSSDPGSEAV